MAKKYKTVRPVKAERRLKDRKDFFRAKFGNQSRTHGLFVRRWRAMRRDGRRFVMPGHWNLTDRQVENMYYSLVSMNEPPPDRINAWKCDTVNCINNGYGPMLRTVVWNAHFGRDAQFQCLRCIMKKLGRPIGPRDLRDCRMNEWHPAFQPHDMM